MVKSVIMATFSAKSGDLVWKFDGTGDVLEWMEKFELFCRLQECF